MTIQWKAERLRSLKTPVVKILKTESDVHAPFVHPETLVRYEDFAHFLQGEIDSFHQSRNYWLSSQRWRLSQEVLETWTDLYDARVIYELNRPPSYEANIRQGEEQIYEARTQAYNYACGYYKQVHIEKIKRGEASSTCTLSGTSFGDSIAGSARNNAATQQPVADTEPDSNAAACNTAS